MPFREIRDPETGELVVKYDPETDAIQYRNRERRLRVTDLRPYRLAIKAQSHEKLAPRRTSR